MIYDEERCHKADGRAEHDVEHRAIDEPVASINQVTKNGAKPANAMVATLATIPRPLARIRVGNCSASPVANGPEKAPSKLPSTICMISRLPKEGLA